MRKPLLTLAALMLLVVPNSGCYFLRGVCCCLHHWHQKVCSRTFCGDSCGEKYHCEWCSDPPDCYDPCDCHGEYTGCNRSRWAGQHRGCPECNAHAGYVDHGGEGEVIEQ